MNLATGMLDKIHQAKLQYRYDYVVCSLTALGYRIDYHPDIGADMVNTYGLLPIPADKNISNKFCCENKDLLGDLLVQITPCHELKDVLIMLECLALFSADDGKPLIIW